ncbi:protein kinase family protein [Legionella rowbothamii]|uniref:protein kinase family protein n=1 Tax=Legionella rowbothamii TaxID=96229 RepID=UPI0013EF8E24|nr:protein kinase family protein [Legionella rowbothamii]
MKLQELRHYLKEYEETFYLRKYFIGDHDRAKRLRTFVQRLKYQSDDYHLSAYDVFKLLRDVPEIAETNSNLELIQIIRMKLANEYFFEIYVALSNLKLISVKNFVVIYELPAHIHLFLQRLFCSDLRQARIPLNEEVFNTVLVIAPQIGLSEEVIEQTFRFLYNKNFLRPIALNLLHTRIKDVYHLFNILQELHKAGCLNEECLELISSVTYFDLLAGLLTQINKAKIPLNNELIKSLCTSNTSNLFYFDKLLSVLLRCKKTILNSATLALLLKKDYDFFVEKTRILVLLQQHDLLDEGTFSYVCSNEVYSLTRVLEVLSEKLLVQENQELINQLMDRKLDSSALYKAINYLKKIDLLDQNTLNSCVEFVVNKRVVCGLLDLLEQNDLNLSKAQLQTIFSLSSSNIKRLNNLLEDLKYSKLLNQHSLLRALERVAEKFPLVVSSTISKHSRKDTGTQRSEFLLDNDYRFFIEHGSPEEGGCGSVKKGYASAESLEPRYAIKKLKPHVHVQEEAAREVKYNRLLGRNATYFVRDNITSVVSEWQQGKGLHHYSKEELCRVPMKARLLCLSTALKDLNTLHQHHRKHGDVKCQNFVLNLDNVSMRLIDFGTSHKKGSFKSFGWTSEYLDPSVTGDLLCVDLYAMGIVTMHLFPELYSVSFENKKLKFSLNKSDFSVYDQSIVTLVNAMMNADLERRCTSEDALNYCNEVINYFDIINEQQLETITENSIHRSHLTAEDILRM